MLGKILDPDPYDATYSQESTNLSESIAVRPIQDLLDLPILQVTSFISASVAHSYNFWDANICFPS